MFERLISVIRGSILGTQASDAADDGKDVTAPCQHAPAASATPARDDAGTGFLCRELVVGRDQRVAGYRFVLREGTRNRIRTGDRRIHHVYAEILVRDIAQANIGRLLGHRAAFLDIPDSFVGHPSLLGLPAANTVLILTRIAAEGAPDNGTLLEGVRRLRSAGYRVGVAAEELLGDRADLLPEADFYTAQAAAANPTHLRAAVSRLKAAGGHGLLLVSDLPSADDFQLCLSLGAALFQGPFITRREDWSGNRLAPNSARLSALIARLRSDADTGELVALLKQDAALSLRLMRYINSPGVGLQREVASIDAALLQLGRERLYRWLLLLLYGADKGTPRSSAAMENALVRARLMELLGEGRPQRERDSLYLTGLLSLVDVILEVPLHDAIRSLGVAPDIEEAVVHGTGPLADLLRLAVACENGDEDGVQAAAACCGIAPTEANRRHLQAFSWALEING
ncbi:HDOD domain-containing protein [Aromatoleum toluolicum]|uniref:HDOD domain-containing protein n=1 Tax=Aromatoleum toluolicum TaxID=90060 RepID=A0ABX1NH45_9RHOO|nr:HDOD domain-containing protein [Aromatoleum toluolicum]NMF98579.1 HDOD domain-containing protein [Aromatoleum toluolicum]